MVELVRGPKDVFQWMLGICCLCVASIFHSSRLLSAPARLLLQHDLLIIRDTVLEPPAVSSPLTNVAPSRNHTTLSARDNGTNTTDPQNYHTHQQQQQRLARLIQLGVQQTSETAVKQEVVQRLADNMWTHLRQLYYNDGNNSNDPGEETSRKTKQEEPSYGGFPNGPVILGMERCEEFRRQWSSNGTIGVASLFNAGSNALTKNLQFNLRMSGHHRAFYHHGEFNLHGIWSQVPWWKHNPIISDPYNGRQANFTEHASILPIVIVRDYYFWRKSTCTCSYSMYWRGEYPKRGGPCPAFFRRNATMERDGAALAANHSTVIETREVAFRINDDRTPRMMKLTYPSLVDVWNSFHKQYVDAPFPRLIIRFEDTLLYLPEIIQAVQECTGAIRSSPPPSLPWDPNWEHTMIFSEPGQPNLLMHRNVAKPHGNLQHQTKEQQKKYQKISALARTIKKNADPTLRDDDMNEAEQEYTRQTLDPRMMRLFHYTYPNSKS